MDGAPLRSREGTAMIDGKFKPPSEGCRHSVSLSCSQPPFGILFLIGSEELLLIGLVLFWEGMWRLVLTCALGEVADLKCMISDDWVTSRGQSTASC